MENGKLECPYCYKSIVDGIPYCPYCGKKQPKSLNDEEIKKNPFEILQVSDDAEKEVIEAAYRSLARKYHPDTGSSFSEERIREINWAHEILSDPEKLAEWKLKNRRRQHSKTAARTEVTPNKKPSSGSDRKSQPVAYPPPPSTSNLGSKTSSKSGNPMRWILGIVVLLLLIGVFVDIFSSIKSQTTYQPNAAIPIRNPTPTRRPANTPTRRPSSMLIKYTNTCSMTIQTAIYYQNNFGNWMADGWWTLGPGETANIAWTINPTFYTYGISMDGNSVWDGTSTYQKVKGSSKSYGFDFTLIEDWDAIIQESGDFEIRFLCE